MTFAPVVRVKQLFVMMGLRMDKRQILIVEGNVVIVQMEKAV